MPTDTKTKRPKMKVEEISEESEKVADEAENEVSSDEAEKPEKTVSEETPQTLASDTTSPKITSFSQLDAQKKADQTETTEALLPTEEEKKPTSEKEEEVEEKEEVAEGKEEGDEKKEKEDVSSSEIKEWLKEVRPDTTKESEKKGGPNTKMVVIVAFLLIILGALVGGVIYYRQSLTEKAPENVAEEETPSPTEEPTQAPEEKVDVSTLSVSILNGSGVAGEAKKAKDELVKAGWTDGKLTVGNADSTDYTKTSVSLKKDLSEKVYEEIEKALKDSYDLEKSDTELEEDSSYDVIIILGKGN